jgi:hypothetical protein
VLEKRSPWVPTKIAFPLTLKQHALIATHWVDQRDQTIDSPSANAYYRRTTAGASFDHKYRFKDFGMVAILARDGLIRNRLVADLGVGKRGASMWDEVEV